MKVRCDRIELGDALNALLGIVPPTQTARPILLNFYLRTDDDRLSVEAMDLDIGARMIIDHVEGDSACGLLWYDLDSSRWRLLF